MKKIFTSADPLLLQSLAHFLESDGFPVLVQGRDRQSFAGAIPPIECWPEIMLLDDEQEPEALESIKRYLAAGQLPGSRWKCSKCGEELGAQFTECWKCPPPPE